MSFDPAALRVARGEGQAPNDQREPTAERSVVLVPP